MDNPNPPTTPVVDTPPVPLVTPPKRPGTNKKLIIIPFAVAGMLLILMIIVSLTSSQRNRGLSQLPVPTQSIKNPNITPTSTPNQIPVTPVPPRLPLSELSGKKILTSVGGDLFITTFTPDGPRKTLFFDTKNEKIVDVSVSPNGNLVAYTFTDPTLQGDLNSFPKTGLNVVNVTTGDVTKYVSLEDNIAVRRPTWSADGIYLAVWNSGKSSTLYDMTNKSSPLEISTDPAGQFVFVPSLSKFSYVENSTLYEIEYSGKKKESILENISPVRSLIAGQILPDPHFYSPDGSSVAYHNNIGQLVVYSSREGKSFQTLAEGMPSRTSSGYFSFGDVIGFDSASRYLVYTNLGKEVYVPGPDDNPVYIYDLAKRTSTPFFKNRKESVDLGGIYVNKSKNKILFSGSGYKVFEFDGTMTSNCENTTVSNDNTYAPERLWSKDNKYFLSRKTFQITNTTNCEISAAIDPAIPDHAIWMN